MVSGALILLGLGRTSLSLPLLSALVFGMGYTVGSSLLTIWTAQVSADRPGDGFHYGARGWYGRFGRGACGDGVLIPVIGLPATLVLVLVLVLVAVVVVMGVIYLAHYEVYRFGGSEFVDPDAAEAVLDRFFDALLGQG